MIEISRTIPATAERVFSVLADGWAYSGWVVGASHVRDVDADWPAIGTRVHHTVGLWPFTIDDTTKVVHVEPNRRLELAAGVWPAGVAEISVTLVPTDEGCTRVDMAEQVVGGPLKAVPGSLQAMLLRPRNKECLRRLSHLAVNRRGDEAGTQPP